MTYPPPVYDVDVFGVLISPGGTLDIVVTFNSSFIGELEVRAPFIDNPLGDGVYPRIPIDVNGFLRLFFFCD